MLFRNLGLVILAAMSVSVLAGCSGVPSSGVQVTQLRCEYQIDPLGIDTPQPHLSWQMQSNQRGQKQTAYQVLVASEPSLLEQGRGDLWNSGKIVSDASIQVAYAGKPLASHLACYWKVRVWDRDGESSAWSPLASWSMGLLDDKDWSNCQWIGRDETAKSQSVPKLPEQAKWIWQPTETPDKEPAPGMCWFRRGFTIAADQKIKVAHLLIAADNYGVAFVNGEQAGLVPAFKLAAHLDVTEWIHTGENVLAVSATNVGEGPNPAGLIAALSIEDEQGNSSLILTTDASWKVTDKEAADWQKATFDASAWVAAREIAPLGAGPWGELTVAPRDESRLPARMLRRQFKADGTIKRAMAYVCGLGYYELYLNGNKVGDHVLDPNLTDPTQRMLYVTYDVTDQMKRGDNAVGVWLGNGRYFAPRITVPTTTVTYGYPKLLMKLKIDYADGRCEEIVSDGQWKLTTDGPILSNNDYDGEEYDARKEMAGWSECGFDDTAWEPVQQVEAPKGTLRAQMSDPIRVMEIVKPIALTNPKDGVYIYDMGQNMVGWVRMKVQGPAGTQVKLRHAETLKSDGTLFTDNLRSAKATDIYTLKGQGVEVYEPRFTYHGFRFVEITGYPGKLDLSTIEGQQVRSSCERMGDFACSNELLNRIYHNITWGVRDNLRSIPTDCPQRDERQGWLGDIANEAKAQSFDFNMAQFYAKWLQDIDDAQNEEGIVPDVAPPFWPIYSGNVTWPAAYVIIPNWYHDQYADIRPVQAHYASLCRWMDFLTKHLKDGLISRDTYGDWCVPPESKELIHSNDPARKTDGTLLGTTYFYHNLKLMARYANWLGKPADEQKFNELAEQVKEAFNRKFFDATAVQYSNGTQTSCVLPLYFGMVPAEHRAALVNRLVENIMVTNKGHLATGLIGGQWLLRTLSDNGRIDVAYTIATQKDYPSWGYMAEKGATTIWELWNGDTADPAMNSHNHLMLVGDLCLWMYEYLGGIKSDADCPGFKHIIMRPHPVGDLTSAKVHHDSQYGRIASSWTVNGNTFTWDITVPVNTTATVYVPATCLKGVTESGKPAASTAGVGFVGMEGETAVFKVQSGQYRFVSTR